MAEERIDEAALRFELSELHAQYPDQTFPDDVRERWNRINETLEHLNNRRERIRELMAAGSMEAGTSFASVAPGESREAGLRAIEQHSHEMTTEAADTMADLVREEGPGGIWLGNYLRAVGDPAYNSAFGKLLMDPVAGAASLLPREREAMDRVQRARAVERAMSLTSASGGYAVPFTLDPTVMLSSAGALNPIRQIARVFTIATDQWKGVSSAGVTATYAAEAAEAGDASPTLAQPTIDCARGVAFIPFSIEIGQDWATLQSEMGRLMADGRDVLDATKFLAGGGTDEPSGVLTGLSTTQRVQTAATATLAVGDVYSLKQALPAFFMPNATWAGHPARYDAIFRLVGGGSTEPPLMETREGPMLGRPKVEWTTMATVSTSGTKALIYGDFSRGFFIADRVGMSVELIPHLFGAANRFPTGQRGLYAFWRCGSKVVVPEAFKYLETL
jgi:HK97 family phage major capsid protein